MLVAPNASELETQNVWITIVTILFALSLISERIGNLIKLHSKFLSSEPIDDILKKKKEKTIMWLALGSGILVSILAGADLFTLLKEGRLVYFSVSDAGEGLPFIKTSIGILLSGVFISMGSKFWHDILDIVLEISNLRKYRAQKEQLEVIDQKQDLVLSKANLLNEKIINILPKLENMAGYIGCHVSPTNYGNVTIVFKFIKNKLLPQDKNWLENYFNNQVLFEFFNVDDLRP